MQIGYCRVSTNQQSHQLQIDALKKDGCEKIFKDKISGARTNRPGLEEALKFARPGDVITVWRLDRLGRSLSDLLKIAQTLSDCDIGLKSLTESLDTTTPNGKLIFHVFGAVAEFERNLIRERVQAGLAAARAQGRCGGRPKSLSDTDLSAAEAMMKNPKLTMSEICNQLQITQSTLYRYFPGGRSALM